MLFSVEKNGNFANTHQEGNNGQYIVYPLNVSSQTHVTTQVAGIHLSEDMLNAAKANFFQKGAEEVFC